MSAKMNNISPGEMKRFLGKDINEFPPEQREDLLKLVWKIKERSKQAEDESENEEPTLQL